jgi:predicted RecB family nuclease
MLFDGSAPSFSATDLASFSGCGQRPLLDRLRALGLARPDVFPDPRMDLLRERGMEHEAHYLETLRAEGKSVVTFEALSGDDRSPVGYARRAAETLVAMRQGPDVIYQGAFYDGVWLGFVDFLLRVPRPSDLGAWSYEVADAKLTREAKAAALLQTCVYSEMLEQVQGVAPERIHLYLGGSHPRLASFRLAHFAAYHRALKRRFLDHVGAASDDPPAAPDPVELCQYCDWHPRCRGEREAADHLSRVAGIVHAQRRALEAAGVRTLAGLASLPLDPPPRGLHAASFQRIREQARVQLVGRERNAPYHELLPLEMDGEARPLGLSALPAPTPHDLFFDIEGADYAYDDGLEYLFGVSDTRNRYRAAWATSPDEEKGALDRFLADSVGHVAAHPGAHIYHYGHYEPTTLKRLVGRYGIRTEELDQLLVGQVFVDLHRIVKQGIRASVEGYSIKSLEAHYAFTREIPMTEANPARARLEYALAAGLRDDEALADAPLVEAYNRDDCASTRALRDWLETLRTALGKQQGREIPRPAAPEPRDETDDERETTRAVRELMEGLLDGVPPERGARTGEEHVRWLAAHLLEWHRREDKSAWWDYFRLRDLSVDELVEETKPLAGLEYVGFVVKVKRSEIHRFRFPPQEHRIEEGKKAVDPHSEKDRIVFAIDERNGLVDLKVGLSTEWDPHALKSLLPDEIVRTTDQRRHLRTTARLLLSSEASLAAWSPASLALLRRAVPTVGGRPLPEVEPHAPLRHRAQAAAVGLDPGVLPVQGPPGTGKTYSGARMIRALLRAGRRVGVTGPSHKVITNLLDAVCTADEDDAATAIHGLEVTEDGGCADARIQRVEKNGHVPDEMAARTEAGGKPYNLVAGTAWLWSMERMERSVDVLVIDEAGQYSLANALAVAPAAPRIILLGDPQQLNQPQKGIHPPGTELSVLEHLAGEDGILEEGRGLFLGETWRMRPEITAYTSELFYESRLRARDDLSNQRLTLADGEELRGLHLVEVPHAGNTRESEEEARAVAGLFRSMLPEGATFTDRHGTARPLTPGDLLVVAPYNAQVSRIKDRLAEAGFPDARVGTVDKFQGQEAPVAIYSLASSSAEDAPRGMAFLYALDRLNVATSRARCATLVVAGPGLLTAGCRRPEEMRMVNGFLRYGEMAHVRSVG